MAMVSISLDIVGSTEIKKQLSEFSYKHNTNLDEHYTDLVRSMLVSMNLFLKLIKQDPVIDLKRLFLVKRIGDEFWYTYDLNELSEIERTRHSTHLVKVLLSFLLEAPFDVTAFLPEAHIREELFWKCTVDLVNHAVDAARISEDELDQFLMELPGRKSTGWDEELLYLRNSLGMGYGYTQGSKVQFAEHSDYIGLEVDRFFRISRDAVKGRILAGKHFMGMLMRYTNPVSGKCSFRDPIDEDSFTTALNDVSVEEVTFSEDKLKGIRGGYEGAYIYNDYAEYSDDEAYWEGFSG